MIHEKSTHRACLLLTATAILLFGGCVRMFFLQDDFYQIALAPSLGGLDWSKTFSLQTGYFRPVTQRILAAVQTDLFGSNPFGYHLVALGLFALNGCLLYSILRRILGREIPAFLGAFFYVTRSAHFLKVYWISAAAEAWMFLFFLLSILAFLRARKTWPGHIGWSAASGGFYLLALLSKETILLLPGLLLAWGGMCANRPHKANGIWGKFDWRTALRLSAPHWIVLAVYLALRLGLGAMGGHGAFLLSKPHRILINAVAYIAMILDVNRELIRQAFLREFPPLSPWLLLWASGFVCSWIALPLWIATRKRTAWASAYRVFWRRRRAELWIALSWMAVTAAPLAAMTLSFYGYYLTPFLGGLALFVALHVEYLLDGFDRSGGSRIRSAIVVSCASLLVLSFSSIRLQESLPHSNFQRAREVCHWLTSLQRELPSPPENTNVLLTGLSRRQYWALGWGHGIGVVYNNRTYRYYSEHEEDNTPDRLPHDGPFLELRLTEGRLQGIWSTRDDGPAGARNSAPSAERIHDLP